jgi:hypothetical protein
VSPLTARVVGAREVVANLKATGERQRRAVFEAIERLGLRLEANVKGEWLSGRALHRRTGRLASSVNTRFRTTAHAATSSTGTNVPYGVAYELAFVGDVAVRGHTRRTSVVFGRHLDHKVLQTVAPYTRSVDMSGHMFLKPALEQLRPTVAKELAAAVNSVVTLE